MKYIKQVNKFTGKEWFLITDTNQVEGFHELIDTAEDLEEAKAKVTLMNFIAKLQAKLDCDQYAHDPEKEQLAIDVLNRKKKNLKEGRIY